MAYKYPEKLVSEITSSLDSDDDYDHSAILIKLMKHRSINQNQLAKLLNTSRSNIYKWRNGTPPSEPMHSALLQTLDINQEICLLSAWQYGIEKTLRKRVRYKSGAKSLESAPAFTPNKPEEDQLSDFWEIDFAIKIESALYISDKDDDANTRYSNARLIAQEFVKKTDYNEILGKYQRLSFEGSEKHGIIYDRLIDALHIVGGTCSSDESIKVLSDKSVSDSDIFYHASALRSAIYHSPVKGNPIFSLTTEALDTIAYFSARHRFWYLQGLSLLDYVRSPAIGYDPVCDISRSAINQIILPAMSDLSLSPLRATASTFIANNVAYTNNVQKFRDMKGPDHFKLNIDLSYMIEDSASLYVPLLKKWHENENGDIAKSRIALSLARIGYIDDEILSHIFLSKNHIDDNHLYLTIDSLFYLSGLGTYKSLSLMREILQDNNYPYAAQASAILLHNERWRKMMYLILHRDRKISLSQGEVYYLSLLPNNSDIIFKMFVRYFYGHFLYLVHFFKCKRKLSQFFNVENFFIENRHIDYVNQDSEIVKGKHIWNIRLLSMYYFMWNYKISGIYKMTLNAVRSALKR